MAHLSPHLPWVSEIGDRIKMKAKSKISILTGVTCLGLAGGTFAAYEFSKDNLLDAKTNIVVYKHADVGFLNVSNDKFCLVLDQEGPVWSKHNCVAISGGLNHDHIINDVNLKYTCKEKVDYSTDVSFKVEFNVDKEILKYVEFAEGSIVNFGFNENSSTATYLLPVVKFTNEKPTSSKAYKDMVNELKGKVISFSFRAIVEE